MADGGTGAARFDSVLAAEIADRYERLGTIKANLDSLTTLWLAFLGGASVGLGAIAMTAVIARTAALPYGVTVLLGGLAFCLGMMLPATAEVELFASNNLVVMAFVNGKVALARLLSRWAVVYAGNLAGAASTAIVFFWSIHARHASAALAAHALDIANHKCGLGFWQAVALGIMGNALVCLAVWLCCATRSPADRILSLLFPITAFAAAGFEHAIASMYFIPIGLLSKWLDPAFIARLGEAGSKVNVANLTLVNFLVNNLIPVTIGNIIGGAGMVGAVYWLIYLRPKQAEETVKR